MTSGVPKIDQLDSSKIAQRVAIKGILLFIIVNLLFAIGNPMPLIGQLSLYNLIFPGRKRLPYGDNPSKDYNLSLYSLEAMFAAHELSGKDKPSSEYRVLLIGDSATWGYLLSNEHTLAGQLNSLNLVTQDNRHIVFYNLGYPVMSLTKDLLILSKAMTFDPDLVIWLVTLESFPLSKQLFPPLLQHNPGSVKELDQKHQLNLIPDETALQQVSFWERTIIGQRRNIADIMRLQFYGFLWAATGIDHAIPTDYTPRIENLSPDVNFHELTPPHLNESQLAIEVLQAGKEMVGKIPMLFINEPMFISHGENSDIRYNFYYPKWAYDDYRKILHDACTARNWQCLDLWNSIDDNLFTNTAIHMTPEGVAQTADIIAEQLWLITAQ